MLLKRDLDESLCLRLPNCLDPLIILSWGLISKTWNATVSVDGQEEGRAACHFLHLHTKHIVFCSRNCFPRARIIDISYSITLLHSAMAEHTHKTHLHLLTVHLMETCFWHWMKKNEKRGEKRIEKGNCNFFSHNSEFLAQICISQFWLFSHLTIASNKVKTVRYKLAITSWEKSQNFIRIS